MKRLFQIAVLMAAMSAAALAQEAPKADAANGRKVYLADGCYQCHGRVGQGGLMTGGAPVLAQTKMPFAAFRRQLRNPINDMPPYPENLLSEKELADIFAYLQSLPGRRPVKDIPILNNDY